MKYPRTPHLPWSKGLSDDDKIITTLDVLKSSTIVVTEKYDGENCTITSEKTYARSLDSASHSSRDWIKANVWANIRYTMPSNMRICGENLFARHSIHYNDLTSFFYGFSLWFDDVCQAWDTTLFGFDMYKIKSVKVLYVGMYDEKKLIELAESLDPSKQEGYVVRVYDEFKYDDFNTHVAKYVRENHVQTSQHWLHQQIVKNQLNR